MFPKNAVVTLGKLGKRTQNSMVAGLTVKLMEEPGLKLIEPDPNWYRLDVPGVPVTGVWLSDTSVVEE